MDRNKCLGSRLIKGFRWKLLNFIFLPIPRLNNNQLMADQQQSEHTSLESCKRLQALSAFRESEADFFEAMSVLNEALFCLNPRAFVPESPCACEAREMMTQIWLKQVQLCLKLSRPKIAVPFIHQLLRSGAEERRVAELVSKLKESGVEEGELRVRKVNCIQ